MDNNWVRSTCLASGQASSSCFHPQVVGLLVWRSSLCVEKNVLREGMKNARRRREVPGSATVKSFQVRRAPDTNRSHAVSGRHASGRTGQQGQGALTCVVMIFGLHGKGNDCRRWQTLPYSPTIEEATGGTAPFYRLSHKNSSLMSALLYCKDSMERWSTQVYKPCNEMALRLIGYNGGHGSLMALEPFFCWI